MLVIKAKIGLPVPLGRVGENKARKIMFPVDDVLRDHPSATFMLLNRREGDIAAYPVAPEEITVSGGYLNWIPTSADLSKKGDGKCEIVATENGVICKDIIYDTTVEEALDESGEAPDPWKSWQQQVKEDADRAEAAAELLEHPGAEATTLDAGEDATAAYSDGTFSFGIPRGADGFSPVISVEEIPGGHEISVTDAIDTETFDVMDGEDGYSPTATVEKVGNTATITITDKDGTTTATVKDGDPADVIDDTAGAGDTDKAWSADKLVGEFSGKIAATEKGAANGVAELDAGGKIPSGQLPSYVDDIIEGYYYDGKFWKEAAHTTEITGESGKIYVDLVSEKTYRWGGSAYVEISESLALGETSSTAYRGDYGKEAHDHATDSGRLTTAKTAGLYKVSVTGEGHVGSAEAVEKSDITALGIPGDIGGKADKVAEPTSGNFAGLDENGNLTDSGSKASDFLTEHQDISGKADKVSGATSGNFAGLDGNGNLTDSGHKHSDYLTQHQDISGKADNSIIAEAYSTSKPYHSGEYVIYNGKLYLCTNNTSGTWDSSKWAEVKACDRITSLRKDLGSTQTSVSRVTTDLAPAFSTTSTYEVGDLVTKDNILYSCDTAITTAGSWDSSKWTSVKISEQLTTVKNAIEAKYTKPENGIPASDLASGVIPSVPVTDVQVNGTSVLSQGVANVPLASTSDAGAVIVGSGLRVSSANKLIVNPATSNIIKAGTETYQPVTPIRQHEAVFYGLASASGDTSQSSSSNSVGTYTEDAKSKISDMLNAPVSVSGSTPSITAKSGVRYICGECSTLTITVPSSGCIDVLFESGSTATVLTVTPTKTGVTAIKWANGFDPTSLEANTTYEVNILDGEFGVVGSWT